MALDPDDPRPPYQQVASDLRAAILSRKLLPGEKLPSGVELAREYGVARMTVQQAIRVLRDDSLVVTRQGSGVYVRSVERPAGVRHHLSRAFRADHVTVDFAGSSGESLQAALADALDQVRAGRVRPRSVSVRALVPDGDRPWVLPARADGSDDPDVRREVTQASSGSLRAVGAALEDAVAAGLVERATAEVRVHPLAPQFKLYVLNGSETFFAFAPVRERSVRIGGRVHRIYDPSMDDDTLVHHRGEDPESAGARYVLQAREWFDSVWTSLARAAT